MARKSVASLSLVGNAPAAPLHGAPVPAELSEVEAALWRETVESKPAEWFGADSWPVLKEYVRAAVTCDALAVAAADAVLSKDGDLIKAVLTTRDREARRMADLATKLRLTQQSRYTPQAAATADKRANGKRPWQSAR